MKNESFRPVDFWKSTLMTMADNLFFELIRSVFGKIKTPFNKQQLLNDLEAFLLSDEIQKTIGSYIDKSDRKIIAAIAILNEPSFEQMQNFFSGEVSFAQLQDIIVNLEERFILYRFTEEKPNVFKTMSLNTNATKAKTCLALNPVLKPVLLPITNETSVLFSTEDEAAEKIDTPVTAVETTAAETTAAKPAAPVMNDLLLAALYSFTYGFDSFYVPEGQIRKRVKQEAKTLFPGLDIEKTFGILQVMGLFYIKEEKIIPEKKYFEDFISISSFERMEYFAAAIIVYSDLNPTSEILPPLYKNKIREAVNFIHNFIQSITSDSEGIPEKNLRRIIEVLKVQTDSGTDIKIDTFFDALERTGLIVKTENGLYKSGAGLFTKEQEKQNSPVIAVDSGFSILVYPEINFNDLIKLASILDISKTDPMIGNTVARFELGKDSAVRSFDNNTTADEIIELLTRLSGEGVKSESSKLNDSIIFNLKDWEKRHKEVSLKKGVVLSLSEEHRYLTETKPLAELIIETLAPGLYMLNENSFDEADEALRCAGIDIIANPVIQTKRKEKKEYSYSSTSHTSYFSPLSSSITMEPVIKKDKKEETVSRDGALALTEKFQAILEKMPLNEAEKSELSARIERRLVLSETQLKDANIRYEKLEARNMDYAGKQNIARQAISTSSPVEIITRNKAGEQKIYGIPRALEKEGNELILLIDLTNTSSGPKNANQLRIPLAKMGLLRRIKKSIFEE